MKKAPALTLDTYRAAGMVRVMPRSSNDTEVDFVRESLALGSMNEPMRQAFGPPDFEFAGHEYTTENWLLDHNGHRLLVSTAEGRGTSYEADTTVVTARFGFNAPDWWDGFLDQLAATLAATPSGAVRDATVRSRIRKAFKR